MLLSLGVEMKETLLSKHRIISALKQKKPGGRHN